MYSLNSDLMKEAVSMNGRIKNDNNELRIIALSGPRACGKSTIAGHLQNLFGYNRIAFADALREISATFSEDLINDRIFLAELGAKIRTFMPDFFIQVLNRKINQTDSFIVIEDVRFSEELEFCRTIGAITVRLDLSKERQILNLEERGLRLQDALLLIECNDEKILDDSANWDYIIPAIGNFEDVAANINSLLGEIR
tara:strand:- start:109 stop:702 length:594 start_codon:yes stop_codon:yes gene_type:complete